MKSSKITVRLAEAKDAANYANWLAAGRERDNNLCDPDAYQYPSIVNLVVEKNGEPGLMTSFHPVIALESIAHPPEFSSLDSARMLQAMFEEVKAVAKAYGMAEIMFMCADPTMIKFIEKRGFERLTHPVFRYKVR